LRSVHVSACWVIVFVGNEEHYRRRRASRGDRLVRCRSQSVGMRNPRSEVRILSGAATGRRHFAVNSSARRQPQSRSPAWLPGFLRDWLGRTPHYFCSDRTAGAGHGNQVDREERPGSVYAPRTLSRLPRAVLPTTVESRDALTPCSPGRSWEDGAKPAPSPAAPGASGGVSLLPYPGRTGLRGGVR
jgi:hypothetical protein